MYQRNELYVNGSTEVLKQPQVFARNKIFVDDFDVAKLVLNNQQHVFLHNQFVLSKSIDVALFLKLLQACNCVFNAVFVNDRLIQQDDKAYDVTQCNAQGSPLAYLVHLCSNNLNANNKLPVGAEIHLQNKSQDIQLRLSKLLEQYTAVFPPELPKTIPERSDISAEHKIDLEQNANIPKRRLYKVSPAEQKLIADQLSELLACGMIRPSNSPFGSPVLFVKKPDGSLRFCVDYRAVNAVTVKDKYPLPQTHELLDQLSGSRFFSSLDLRSGYWQIKIREQDIPKTAFTTRQGLYEWLVMPFGLTNAPATFQRVMQEIFRPFLDKFVVVYLDDILIYSKTVDEHEKHLQQVLSVLEQNRFYCKLKKCNFFSTSTTFLGHLVDGEGLHIDQNKIKAVTEWPEPTNVQSVQRFLGFCNFFRRFIHRFSQVVAPLTELTRKDVQFTWTTVQRDAFTQLKNLVTSAPCLHIPDCTVDDSFEIHTDASAKALSGVLYQRVDNVLRPCAFHSRRLSAAEENYSATDRELLAIVDSLRAFRHYVHGLAFIVRTDHALLQYYFSQPHVSGRAARWLERLSKFQPGLQIMYQAGRLNIPADLLSRRSDYMQQLAAISHSSDVIPTLGNQQRADVELSDMFLAAERARRGSDPPTFLVETGVLKRVCENSTKLVVAPSALRAALVADVHSQGHFGPDKTVQMLRRTWWWPGMAKQVQQYCRECKECQVHKPPNAKPYGLLMPLESPTRPWEHISMDLVTDLPCTSDGFCNILSVVDLFSKYCVFIPLQSDTTADVVANAFVEHVVRRFGVPQSIVSDRDRRFTSKFWQTLWRQLNVSLRMSSAYHPQTDGQTERMHRTLEQVLRTLVEGDEFNWCKMLPYAEMYMNNTPSDTTKVSPHEVVYGKPAINPFQLLLQNPDQPSPSVTSFAAERQAVWQRVHRTMEAAKAVQKRQVDKHRRSPPFSAGDYVLLSTRNIKLQAYTSRKLQPRFIGPYRITAQKGTAYTLELPPEMSIFPTFHAGLLKPYHGEPPTRPPPYVIESQEEYEVQSIVAHRESRGHPQYLVRWKGYGPESDTWQSAADLEHSPLILAAYKRNNNIADPA